MSLALDIAFDTPTPNIAIGEHLRGRVVVHVEKACPCKSLNLSLRVTTSRGCSETMLESPPLFEGEWSPGTYEYPFSIEVPDGLPTFRGKVFDVDWVAVATADIPWKLDPSVERMFTVSRKTREPRSEADVGSPILVNAHQLDGIEAPTDLHKLGVIVALLGVSTLVMLGSSIVAREGIFFVLTFLVLLITVGMGARLLMARKRQSPIIDLRFGMAPEIAKPGDTVVLELEFAVKQPLEISRITGTIVAVETYSYRINNSHSYETERSIVRSCSLSEARAVQEGDHVRLTGAIELPADAPPSFKSYTCSIRWHASFLIKSTAHEEVYGSLQIPVGSYLD
mgnify:FL=1